MRDLTKLIDRMIEVIPETESELINTLKDNRESAKYAAPEMIYEWFNVVFENLTVFIFQNWQIFEDEDSLDQYLEENGLMWQEKLRQIWVGEK